MQKLKKIRSHQKVLIRLLAILVLTASLEACVTKKKKGDVSKLGKFYHNTTSEYNGYFNANELMKESEAILRENNNDNYSKLLDVYDYVSVNDPKMVYGQLDKAIEKVTRVAAIHSPGDWVDDCYVLMGKAQFLKQDYETSVETFEYFQDAFNPSNPFGRNYQKRKLQKTNSKAAAKERKKEQETKQKEREDTRKETQKAREDERKAQAKQKEDERKAREKAAKDRKKKSSSSRGNSRSSNTRGTVSRGTTTRPTTRPATGTQPKDSVASPVVQPASTDTEPKKEEPAKVDEPKPADDKITDKKDKAGESAYYEGMMWLARGYTRTEQYTNAEYLLKRIDEVTGHRKEVVEGWNPSMADLMIKQKRFQEATMYLEKSIETASRSEDKARYAFIAGQIASMLGQYAEAGDYFDMAMRKAGKDFKLRFMAELNQLKNYALSGRKSQREIETALEKMLAEDKNKLYRDQIYFALGDIALKRGESEKAREFYSLSVQNNVSDPVLKGEAYYKVANMYYLDKKYLQAKLYFDSTAQVMVEKDVRKPEVQALASKLSGVAAAMKELNDLDSLLAMANMDKEELYEIARDRKNKASNGGQATDKNATNSGLYIGKSRSISLNSTFFAYNPINIENGKKDFKDKWGNRNLEDNWRRSNKSLSLAGGQLGDQGDLGNRRVEEELDEEEFNKLMADVPFSAEKKAETLQKINLALYKAGSALKLDLEDYKESNRMLERLIASEAQGFEKRIDALYLLYTNYQTLDDVTNANRIKSMILRDYPESNYAKIIQDPSYVNQLISEAMAVDNYYEDTYKMFEQRNYANVILRAQESESLFGSDNPFRAKFSLLRAMSIGFMEGKEAYLKALQETVVRYPGTPEDTKAKEIIRFLRGDESSFKEVDIKEVDNIYSKEDESRHYVAVVLFNYSDQVLQQAKISVLNYNKEYFKLENLQLGDQILSKDEGTQVILVRSFDNMAKARKYYDTIIKDQEKFISSSITAYEIFPITQRNFRKMITEKSHAGYRAFFEANYK